MGVMNIRYMKANVDSFTAYLDILKFNLDVIVCTETWLDKSNSDNSNSHDSNSLNSDVKMSTMASQITGVSIVYSTVCSGAGQRKHQSSAPLAFVWGMHRWPMNAPHKGPVTRNMFPFDDVIMLKAVVYCILGCHVKEEIIYVCPIMSLHVDL